MVHSAGSTVGGPEGAVVDTTFGPIGPWSMFATKTTLYAGIAIFVMVVASRLNVHQLFTARGLSNPLLIALFGALALQVLTMIPGFGHEVNGAYRWLKVGPITFQPSELVKWVMVLAVAWWCARRSGVMHRFGAGVLPALALILAACLLVVREDLGTAVLIGMVAVVLLIAGGMRLWVLVPVFVVGAAGIVAAIMAAPYRIKRLMIYRDPWAEPDGAGYHPIQSQLAFAEGGVGGSGLGHSVQKYYIPEDTTDFIFPVLTEELGLAGAALVIGLFLTILWVGLGIIRDSKDPFSRLVGLGILTTMGVQAAINIAVVTVVVPTKGIALPLVSNGGTGWIMTAGALGLLAAIDNATAIDEAEALSTDDDEEDVQPAEPQLRLTGADNKRPAVPDTPTILFVGGGSGGHIYPNVAVAERLAELGVGIDARFVVSERAIDDSILKKLDLRGHAISALPLALKPRGFLKFFKAFKEAEAQTFELIRATNAKAMLATGGFVSGPALKAASRAGIPNAMANLDAVPGKSNRFTARYASDLFSAYETTKLGKAQQIGVPLRSSVINHVSAEQARLSLGLDPDLNTLLVFGGSQGGGTVNKAMAELVSRATVGDLFEGWQIMHMTGEQDLGVVKKAYERQGIPGRVEPFCTEMGRAWGSATLAVCRAGAGTVAESWANAVPCLYMPYPFHKDEHQRLNAAPVVNRGGGMLLKDRVEKHDNVAELMGPLRDLMKNTLRREQMRKALEESRPADGATTLAEWLITVLGLTVSPSKLRRLLHDVCFVKDRSYALGMETDEAKQQPTDAELIALIDDQLRTVIAAMDMPGNLKDAISYALFGGGKRIRPLLCMRGCIACGGTAEAAVIAASAVELIHTFSLVHDDLPAMDDDDFRRGRPTLHKHTNEAMAILAGDAMTAIAFQLIAQWHEPGDAELVRELTHILSSSTNAMIAGQVYDTMGGFDPNDDDLRRLSRIHRYKTGALIQAACQMGGVCARSSPASVGAMMGYADAIGLMFQAVDDLLDVTQSSEKMGKATGKDAEQGKLTYPGLLGIDGTRAEIDKLLTQALDALSGFDAKANPIQTVPPDLDPMAYDLLQTIAGPADLKKLSIKELKVLAQDIRDAICDQVSQSGGHLAPNLGVVELTLALHYVFDFGPPRKIEQDAEGESSGKGVTSSGGDRLLFDVGHQCYPHKLVTGRLDLLPKLRQRGGMAGFPEPSESDHDLFSVGHAGTAISTAVGMARGDQLMGQGNRRVVSLIGDASIVNGVALEGLNNAGTLNRQFLVVLNDNGMSIAKPQGAMAAYFDRVRVSHHPSTSSNTSG
eukprot:g12242.t1